jgi:tetratricopeptide (TPR) repeat protein
VELEQEALKLTNQGDFKTAIELYKKIVEENPNYEFGACFYNMACCYEELGELEKARENYLKAIEYSDDSIKLGGYASFLYLHGDTEEALEAHLKLLGFEKKWRHDTSRTLGAINFLAKKNGLTDQEISRLIENA